MIETILLILVVGPMAYFRLAPSDPKRWHRRSSSPGMGEIPKKGGFVLRKPVEGDGKDKLRALDAVVMATPRTKRLVGSAEEGQTTYVTRSRVFGFPDYTTISVHGEESTALEVNGRLRFGRSDLGVNAKRIKGWVADVEV